MKGLVIDIRTPDVPAEMIAPMRTVVEGEEYCEWIHGRHRGLMDFRQKTGIPYVMVSYIHRNIENYESRQSPGVSNLIFCAESKAADHIPGARNRQPSGYVVSHRCVWRHPL